VWALSDDNLDGIFASRQQSLVAILSAEAERQFPLVFKRGELVGDDTKEIFPFAIIVSWRRSRSMWLPQLPVVIFTSARAMRLLKAAK
jgi:hypothetical protein